MSSRDKILSAVKANQPAETQLPDLSGFYKPKEDPEKQFISTLEGIGGKVYTVKDETEALEILQKNFDPALRKITVGIDWPGFAEQYSPGSDPHLLENVELAIIRGTFGVAENGAVWVREEQMGIRALPFICQHLAIIIPGNKIVPHMHAAYDVISSIEYGFASFIAGPSKTADIEQSLVLGAHGPISATIFLIQAGETAGG